MKLDKKVLSLILAGGISIFTVGCNAKDNKEVKINSGNEPKIEESIDNNSEDNIADNKSGDSELLKEDKISEKEALKLIEKEVHKLVPQSKLKVESKEYVNGTECYVIKYDTDFATDMSFIVDVNTGKSKATVFMADTYESMEDWVKYSSQKLDDEYYSPEEAKNRVLYTMSFDSGDYHRPGFSDYQEANIELAEDYRVEVQSGNFCWVFKYPMEKEHVMTDKGYSEDNAYNKSDKYGYFYVDPRMNWVMFRPDEWHAEELLEVGSSNN